MSVPIVVSDAHGITVPNHRPMSPQEARQLALALLEVATEHVGARTLRRCSDVDEAFREREGGV